MRGFLFSLLIIISGLTSCDKKESEPVRSAFEIKGITSGTIQKIVVGRTPELYCTYEFDYVHSEQELVTLAFENVPTGLWYRFSSGSGIPSFKSSLFMADSGVAPGIYELTIVATGEKSGRKTLPFKLTVLAPIDCSHLVTGNNLLTYNSCFSVDSFYQDISPVPGEPSKIVFSNFHNSGQEVYGIVQCDWQRVVIPSHKVNGAIYEGDGFLHIYNNRRVLEILYRTDGRLCSAMIMMN